MVVSKTSEPVIITHAKDERSSRREGPAESILSGTTRFEQEDDPDFL